MKVTDSLTHSASTETHSQNPLLYRAAADTETTHPTSAPTSTATSTAAIVDAVGGNNRCSSVNSHCCTYGFEATQGWDASTGLGSLRVDKLLEYLQRGPCTGMRCTIGGDSNLNLKKDSQCQAGRCVCHAGYRLQTAQEVDAALTSTATGISAETSETGIGK